MTPIVQNESLLKKKKQAILEFKQRLGSRVSSLFTHVNYHDVSFVLEHCETKFCDELNRALPSSWLQKREEAVRVTMASPEEFGIDLDEWENEAEQDCYLLEGETLIVQRDFIAKILNDEHILLMTKVALSDGFYNFLRWFLPRKMLAKNKYVLHSSCVLDEKNNAHFFLGHSGAGKTTITSLSSDKTILGDDMNIFFEEEGQFYASPGGIGGAFLAEVSYDKKFPVASVNWIIQDDKHERKEIEKSEAASKLIASISNLFWGSLDEKFFKQIFDFSFQAVNEVKFFDLYFKKDHGFWNLLLKEEGFVLNDQVKAQPLADEFFLLDSENEVIHELNTTGQWIYHKIAKKWTMDQIAKSLMEEFDIDYKTAYGDTECLVERLINQNVISHP